MGKNWRWKRSNKALSIRPSELVKVRRISLTKINFSSGVTFQEGLQHLRTNFRGQNKSYWTWKGLRPVPRSRHILVLFWWQRISFWRNSSSESPKFPLELYLYLFDINCLIGVRKYSLNWLSPQLEKTLLFFPLIFRPFRLLPLLACWQWTPFRRRKTTTTSTTTGRGKNKFKTKINFFILL